jgi:sporulation protein YlmC with PRC-barrel domain
MSVKHIAIGLVASALLSSAAFAQTSTTTTAATPVASSDTSTSFQGDWRTSKVVGLNVYNDNNESVGSINDLLTDKSGNIKAVVVGVGGFLGVGEHLVAVPFDKIKFVNEPVAHTAATATGGNTTPARPATGVTTAPTAPSTTTTGTATGMQTGTPASTTVSKPNPWYPDHAVLNSTKDELKAMPEFKYSM